MYVPSKIVIRQPVAPNAAVVANAGMYFGASLVWKILLLTTPMRLARGTPTDVNVMRWPSFARLLLYHVLKITEGADVPQTIMKHAKYATCSCLFTSIVAYMMKPMNV